LDNNYRKLQQILNQSTGKFVDKKEEPRRRWAFQKKEKDPDAMDVDALKIEKRDEMMRKGLCFVCVKPGHLNRDCPDKKKPAASSSSSPPSYSPPKKMGAKELYTHIRSLTALMNETEKEEFYSEAEKEGFKLESCLNVDLSNSRYLLCNNSNNKIEFFIYSYHDQTNREERNRRNPRTH
jgi:hypothetical protein